MCCITHSSQSIVRDSCWIAIVAPLTHSTTGHPATTPNDNLRRGYDSNQRVGELLGRCLIHTDVGWLRRSGQCGDIIIGEFNHRSGRSTPSARNLFDGFIEYFKVLDLKLTADRIVMKPSGATSGRHVEAGQVATGAAAVARGSHRGMVPPA